jgi:hypothetical protein
LKPRPTGPGGDVPRRPFGSAIAGWILAVFALRGFLALPDLPGWFVAIGLIGAVPGFVCSWLTLRVNKKQGVDAPTVQTQAGQRGMMED